MAGSGQSQDGYAQIVAINRATHDAVCAAHAGLEIDRAVQITAEKEKRRATVRTARRVRRLRAYQQIRQAVSVQIATDVGGSCETILVRSNGVEYR